MARRTGTAPTTPVWAGDVVRNARIIMARTLPAACARGCGRVLTGEDPGEWVVGHKKARATHPHLTLEPSNWQIECRPCSDSTGQATVIAKARAEGAAAALATPGNSRVNRGERKTTNTNHHYQSSKPSGSLFSRRRPSPQSPPLPRYPHYRGVDAMSSLESAEWLLEFAEVPEDAAPPLHMSPPHPRAVGSYGPQAVDWVRENLGIELRWWQRLAFYRQLEHDENGDLVWSVILESCPRRAGKSVRLRSMALWRLAHADLIGEKQMVLHTGRDLPIAREIHRAAWRWADERYHVGWVVRKSMGGEEIESPDGSRWLVRSVHGLYGYDVGLGMVDEAWDVEPRVVDEGLEPAMLERKSPQLHLTSTAHRRATSLMRKRLAAALAGNDPNTLVLLWAAPADADPSEEETWRAASPHWTEQRRAMIASKYAAAQAGEDDPEADDPDPMAGFIAQYLNVWRMSSGPARLPGEAVVDEDEWSDLLTYAPDRTPDTVAVEGWFADGVSVARAWRGEDGRVTVAVTEHPTMAAAAEAVRLTGFRGTVAVGYSLASDPALTGIKTNPVKEPTTGSVKEISRLIADDVLRHDGALVLTAQVVAMRTSPSADGIRMRSTGRADAVKAAAWAAKAARAKTKGKPRILMPTA